MYDPNRIPLTPQQQIDQTRVRPWLKVAAAVLFVFLGAIFASSGVKLFSATAISIAPCQAKRRVIGQLLCEWGNLVLTHIPHQHRGAYEGALHLLVAAGFMFAAFLMLKRSRK